MRAIFCPVCQVDDTRPVHRRQEQGLLVTTVICRRCGLVYHNPVLEDEDRQRRAASFQAWHTDATPTPRHLRKLERRWQGQWSLIERIFRPASRVLEIGCGLGVMGGHLKGLGAQVLGVEPDPEQADYARRRWGLSVLPQQFEEVDLAGEQFDLILSSHVIEHFPEPLAFLVKARTLAHPETWLFLETPNILAPKVGPSRVFSLAHNFYFAPRTLNPLLLKAGWQVAGGRVWRRDAFQVLARPCPPQNPQLVPQTYQEVFQAIARHRYLYYVKLLFLWRKIPWWQRYWMYTPNPRYGKLLEAEEQGPPAERASG
jgi:2-polyprenyl-3-methyl-5-hydroxy-6-metoxy-1,4-benzoquinol methylase